MIDLKQFESADPTDLYARMRPDQRTAIANEFVRMLTLVGDPKVDELRREDSGSTDRKAGDVARGAREALLPRMLSPQEVARMHVYARDHRHDVFEEVLEHPVTQAALAHPGEEPGAGDAGLEAADIQPTVDVPSSLDKAAIDPMLKP